MPERPRERPRAVTGGAGRRERAEADRPAASHLHTSDSELSQGSAHLGGSCEVVFAVGDDLDQQGVVVGGDDGSLEGGSVIQADAHALSAPEHLQGEERGQERSGARVKVRPGPQRDKMHEGPQLWVPRSASFCRFPQGSSGSALGQRGRPETPIGAPNSLMDRDPGWGTEGWGAWSNCSTHMQSMTGWGHPVRHM